MDGRHYFDPNFKPDFNLFRLRENNYICHIFVVKKSLTDETGLLRSEFDGAQDFDLILRLTERAQKVAHVPKVLYWWRGHGGSTASGMQAKPYALAAGAAAVAGRGAPTVAERRSPVVGRRSPGVTRAIMPHRPRSQKAPGARCPGLDRDSRRYRGRCPRCSNRYQDDRSGPAPAWQACFAGA